jgi:hypothetical protein
LISLALLSCLFFFRDLDLVKDLDDKLDKDLDDNLDKDLDDKLDKDLDDKLDKDLDDKFGEGDSYLFALTLSDDGILTFIEVFCCSLNA